MNLWASDLPASGATTVVLGGRDGMIPAAEVRRLLESPAAAAKGVNLIFEPQMSHGGFLLDSELQRRIVAAAAGSSLRQSPQLEERVDRKTEQQAALMPEDESEDAALMDALVEGVEGAVADEDALDYALTLRQLSSSVPSIERSWTARPSPAARPLVCGRGARDGLNCRARPDGRLLLAALVVGHTANQSRQIISSSGFSRGPSAAMKRPWLPI